MWGSKKDEDNPLRCSFCHKSQDVVGKLISSPNDYPRAYICDECIAVCNSILVDDRSESARGGEPMAQQINEILDQLLPEELDAVRHLLEVMLQSRLRGFYGRASSTSTPPDPTG